MNDSKTCTRCGEQNPAEIHTCTPLALRLADAIDVDNPVFLHDVNCAKAAAELRRLHAENDQLQRALRGAELGSRANFVSMQQQAALKTELLEFAEEVRRTGDTRLSSMAIAAIAKVEGAVR